MLEIPHDNVRSSTTTWIITASVFILFVSFLVWYFTATNTMLNKDSLGKVSKSEFIAKITAYGKLEARNSYTVVSKIEGTIDEILVYPGERIEEGQQLIKLVNPELDRAVELAELELLKARSTFESASSEIILEEVRLENELEISDSNLRFAKEEVSKLQTLVEKQIVSELDFLRAKTNLELSQIRLKLASRNLDTFKTIKEAKETANALSLQSAKQNLTLALEDREHLIVKAEQAGVLSSISENIKQGQTLSKGQIIFTVIEADSLFASVLVTASEANQISLGQDASIQIRDVTVDAKVLRVFPTVINNQVKVELEAIRDFPKNVRESLDVSSQIVTSRKTNALIVERPFSVTKAYSTVSLFVLDEDDFIQKEITIGNVNNSHVEIVSGLQVDDIVALDVPQRLKSRLRFKASELNE